MLGINREEYVAPTPKPSKPVEAGTIKDKDKRKAALDKAYKAQQEKDKFKDPAPKPKYKVKGDKADVKSYVDVNKEEKKKDPFADLSADRGTGGYRGGRATGGLVSRRKSKKKT